jgi:hypothetical protein
MESHGASHRITQKRAVSIPEVAPIYSNGSKVTTKRPQAPRNLMFDKEGGHDPAVRDVSPYLSRNFGF